MKALIVSDVHSNFEALTRVIESAGASPGFDEIWSLGDLVGYGPDPAAVIDLVREHDHRAVAGNHDLACVGRLSLEAFNQYAAAANIWTGQVLDQERREFLGDQPLKLEIDEFTIVHGSPRDPIWEYVVSERAAVACFNHFDTYWCLVGHSHIPFICRMSEDQSGVRFFAPLYGTPYSLADQRLIVNPGGLGAAARRRSPGSLCRIRLRRRHYYSLPHRVRLRRNPGEDALTRIARILDQPPGLGTVTGGSEKTT